ncbi:MAG: chloride channel protein [Trueperaceae bacterium]|nr:chloride channel protein [Trueperaceae bacterium]
MRVLLRSFLSAIKDLNVLVDLPGHFDGHERRLVFQAIVIGILVWGIVFALKSSVHLVFSHLLAWLEHTPYPFLVFIPLFLAGALVSLLARFKPTLINYRDADGHIHELNDVEGDGLERAIALYYSSEPQFESSLLGQNGIEARWEMPTFSLVWRKFLATFLTLGGGGSGGLEASVTLIGESTASGLFKPRRIRKQEAEGWWGRLKRWWGSSNTDDLQTAQLCGIAAAVATLLGTAFTAAFFAIEVMYRRRPVVEKLIYALVSSLTALILSSFVVHEGGLFQVEEVLFPVISTRYYLALIIMAIAIALLSVYFGRLRSSFEASFLHLQPNSLRRHLLGAGFTAAIALLVYYLLPLFAHYNLIPQEALSHRFALILGPGEEAIDLALSGHMVFWVALIALFGKMLATLATVGSGGSAGLLVPSIFFGTMVATIMARLFGLEPQTLIVPAMTASLVSIVNVPLAAVFLPFELFGQAYLLPALVVLIVCFLFAHQNTIYRTQRETHAKREILPGYGSRRVGVPKEWAGKSLLSLDLRRRFEVSVVGIIERYEQNGRLNPRVQLNPAATKVLSEDDVLVVIGTNSQLDDFETKVQQDSQGSD